LAVAACSWIAAAVRSPVVAGAGRNPAAGRRRVVVGHNREADHSRVADHNPAACRPFCRRPSRPARCCTLATAHHDGTSDTERSALHPAAPQDKDGQFRDRRLRAVRLRRHPAATAPAAWAVALAAAASPVPASPAPAGDPREAEAGCRSAQMPPAQPKALLQGESNERCGVPYRPAPLRPRRIVRLLAFRPRPCQRNFFSSRRSLSTKSREKKTNE